LPLESRPRRPARYACAGLGFSLSLLTPNFLLMLVTHPATAGPLAAFSRQLPAFLRRWSYLLHSLLPSAHCLLSVCCLLTSCFCLSLVTALSGGHRNWLSLHRIESDGD
jgi:hypothetical protein